MHVVMDSARVDQSSEPTSTQLVAVSTLGVATPDTSELPLPLVRKQAYSASLSSHNTPDLCPRNVSSQGSFLSGRTTSGSPQINYKPRHTPIGNMYASSMDGHGCGLGAVARLAIDGGLSPEHLSHIGHSSRFTPPTAPTASVSQAKPSETHPSFHSKRSGLIIPADLRLSYPASSTNPCTQFSQRPVHQPIPRYVTHQEINLTRAAHLDYTSVQRSSHMSHHRCPRKYHLLYTYPPKFDPLPLQMTRVGGLVLNSATVSAPAPSEHQVTLENLLNKHISYHSVSACASPTSLKHTAHPSSHTTFFSSATCTPSSAGTPPPPIPSAANSFGDIVRLGPGSTVTRAAPGESGFNVTDLIRMHDCPQPYIGMCPVGSGDSNSSALPTLHGDYGADYPTSFFPVCSTKTHETDAGHLTDFTNTSVSDTEPRYSDQDHHVSPTISLQNPIHLPARAVGFPPPGTQVARTMRYLRRIRHIFGDSLVYTGSATSVSTGALAVPEKNTNSSSSMVELRSHEERSVEAVRPASYSCNCPVESFLSEHERVVDGQPLLNHHSSDYVNALVLFDRLSNAHPPDPTSWMSYRARIVDNVLILTRASQQNNQLPECSPPNQLEHVHIPLCDADITWGPFDERPEKQLQVCDHSALRDHNITSSVALRMLRISTPNIKCFLLMDWELTMKKFDISLPPIPKVTTSKVVTDRSRSLGIAGPPGATPLFRAIGTAAASIGLPVVGRTSVPSLFHISSLQKSSGISDPITSDECSLASDWRICEPKDVMKSVSDGAEKHSSSRRQPHSNHGCFHQAFTRMRRMASPTDASSNSASTTNATDNRPSVSTHTALSPTKSGVSGFSDTSVPCTDIPSCRLPEFESELPSSASSRLPTDALSSCFRPFSLAASVSPTPALRTPYLTIACAPADLESTPNQSSSALASRFVHPSCNYDEELLKSPSPNGTHFDPSESSLPAPIDQSVRMESTPISTQSETKLSDNASGFIPLPLSPSGHLALHKCPRSTLSPFVPFVVELCVTLVEQYGLNCVGLYRLSGSKVAHDFISTELQKALPEIDVHSDKWNDIHAVCGVLKTVLRNLPDSLFPKVMYTDFLTACRLPQREKRLLSIQRLLGIMECYPHHPEYRAHRATLRYLATHLARVSAREAVNKMTAYNLALVFAPNLVQPCEDTPELLMSDSKFKILLVETVIKYHAWIFSPDLGLESGCSIPPDSVEDLSLIASGAQSELELLSRSPTDPGALAFPNANLDSEDPANQPGRLEGDVRPLVAELLRAAADLPPPPSDTDLETAEEPGPSSDRPSDIAMLVQRPRFTSIPTGAWSVAALRSLDPSRFTDSSNSPPELLLTQEIDLDTSTEKRDCDVSTENLTTLEVSSKRPFAAQLGSKLDSLRHLSQGCLDHYTSEARELGVRVAENQRHLQNTVAQRLYAEQLLQEARSQITSQLSSEAQPSVGATESCPAVEEHIVPSDPAPPKPDDITGAQK